MSKKNEQIHQTLWYVLVQLGGESEMPNFYIYHSWAIGPWLKNDHSYWLGIPKKNGEPRKDTDMRRFRPTAEELEKHKGNWEKMFSSLGALGLRFESCRPDQSETAFPACLF